MARRKKHEEHVNAEAWAIPYGDLVTLLMALFVVLYAVSTVNEGKYRVLSDSLSRAFNGQPKSLDPIQIGQVKQGGNERTAAPSMIHSAVMDGGNQSSSREKGRNGPVQLPSLVKRIKHVSVPLQAEEAKLRKLAETVERALQSFIDRRLIIVRRTELTLEIEINTDILYPSGSALLAPEARTVLSHLATILAPFPNSLRIEGHTDNQPISTSQFPSNWELSSARASSVVHLFADGGVPEQRMSVIGYGEYRPRSSNDTLQGRTQNRRVSVVVLALEAEEEQILRARHLQNLDLNDPESPEPPILPVTESTNAGGV